MPALCALAARSPLNLPVAGVPPSEQDRSGFARTHVQLQSPVLFYTCVHSVGTQVVTPAVLAERSPTQVCPPSGVAVDETVILLHPLSL